GAQTNPLKIGANSVPKRGNQTRRPTRFVTYYISLVLVGLPNRICYLNDNQDLANGEMPNPQPWWAISLEIIDQTRNLHHRCLIATQIFSGNRALVRNNHSPAHDTLETGINGTRRRRGQAGERPDRVHQVLDPPRSPPQTLLTDVVTEHARDPKRGGIRLSAGGDRRRQHQEYHVRDDVACAERQRNAQHIL